MPTFLPSFFLPFSSFLLLSSSIFSFSGVSVKILVLPARLFFLGRGATGVFWHTCVNGFIFSMLTCVLVEKTVDGEEDGDFEAASIDENDESAVETASVDDEDDSSFVVWFYHM